MSYEALVLASSPWWKLLRGLVMLITCAAMPTFVDVWRGRSILLMKLSRFLLTLGLLSGLGSEVQRCRARHVSDTCFGPVVKQSDA